MGSHDRTALIHGFSQEFLKKEDVRSQTQSLYNLDQNNWNNGEFSDTTKIFVGGLPGDLTLEEFKAYFEQFGSIQDVVVMCDRLTNRPRGFGFVTFDSPETANNVIKNRFYELKNKRVEVKKAVSKDRMSRNFWNNWDVYDAMYNFGGSGYGYGTYNGYGYQGLSYGYYPYQSPYQSLYGYTTTYSYQSLFNYGIPMYSSWFNSHKYRNRTPIVVKNPNVKDGDDSEVARKNARLLREKGETQIDHIVESNGKGSVVKDVLENDDHGESAVKDVLENGDHCEIIEVVSLCCNGEAESDGDIGCAEFIEALSLYTDVSAGKQMGVDGQSSSCTADS